MDSNAWLLRTRYSSHLDAGMPRLRLMSVKPTTRSTTVVKYSELERRRRCQLQRHAASPQATRYTTRQKQRSHRPHTCHLGSYFNRPKISPVRPLPCIWYYCAQFIAQPKAACALRFSWAATSSNLDLSVNMTSSIKPPTPPEKHGHR